MSDEHGYEEVPEGEYEEDEASRLREEVEMLKVARIFGYQDSGKTRLTRALARRW